MLALLLVVVRELELVLEGWWEMGELVHRAAGVIVAKMCWVGWGP